MNQQDIIRFYNNFFAKKQKAGLSERNYHLYRKMKTLGLQSSSRVLELGCGIGILTFLLTRTIKKGIIEAVDISPESIHYLKSKIKAKNLTCYDADIVEIKPHNTNFDFITLFDVIEHIPVERHDKLFNTIGGLMGEHSLLLINIPNPYYLEYDMKYHPQRLQIIDQPIHFDQLSAILKKNKLTLRHFETYSVWVRDDYQFMIVTREKEFKEIPVSHERNIFQKIFHRIKWKWLEMIYPY